FPLLRILGRCYDRRMFDGSSSSPPPEGSPRASTEEDAPARTMPGVCVGRIAEIDAQGRPWVDFPGNIAGPRLARVLGRVAPDDLRTLHRRGAEVLLGFENGEARLPILIAVTLLPTASPEVSGTSLTEAKARTPEA